MNDAAKASQLYSIAIEQWGSALERLANAYEANEDKRRDLSQEIHFQLWKSFHHYDARCSLRTWTYRVAHNVSTSHVIREKRIFSALVSLEEIEHLPDEHKGQTSIEQNLTLTKLATLIQRLKPLDRQVIICWLEGINAESTAEITGLSPGNVAVRINRIKNILARQYRQGGCYVS